MSSAMVLTLCETQAILAYLTYQDLEPMEIASRSRETRGFSGRKCPI